MLQVLGVRLKIEDFRLKIQVAVVWYNAEVYMLKVKDCKRQIECLRLLCSLNIKVEAQR